MAVSVRDVARVAGVSVGTVSNVLNRPEKVSPETVVRVNDAISSLGFVRNAAARQLRAGRSTTIGLVVLDIRNPFFTEVARGAEQRAEEHGLTVLVANSDDNPAREARLLDQFEQQRVRGVLMTPVAEVMPRLRQLRERGIPSVLVDRSSSDGTFPSVAVDDIEGGRLAAEHLISAGRRRLAFVGGPLSTRQVADRLTGAQLAVAGHSEVTLELIGTESLTVDGGRRAAERIEQRGADARPDGIFAANDLIALGVLQRFVMVGDVRVPEDVAVIGYDDIDFAAAAVIPLSSIRQPAVLIGSTAVDLLLAEPDGSGGERIIRFQPELVVRSTSGTTDA